MPRAIGRMLNDRWKVGARHALYHKDGKWYHQLTDFPGALFEPSGYVLFESEEAFKGCRWLSIDKDVNISGHLSQIPGYVRVPKDQMYNGT